MLPELLSIIIGGLVFYMIFSFEKEEEGLDSITAKRLDDIKNKTYTASAERDEAKNKIQHNIKMLVQDTEYKVKLVGTILDKIKLTIRVKKMLKIADIKVTVDVFLAIPVLLFTVCCLLAIISSSRAMVFIALGIILGVIPFILVNLKIKKRLEQFTQQFPDALGLISSSLRAGHSLTSSFQMVVQEMPEPINQIFKMVVDDISLGRDTRESLENMTDNMPGSIDLRFFITAVLIQREIGGNLAEILDNLNYTIRERFKLIGQLNSQTAQAKMSGIVLALAPAFIGLIIWLMNPKYMDPLFHTGIGVASLAGSITMAIVGYMIINKITNIKI